jgi:hypothetical protein
MPGTSSNAVLRDIQRRGRLDRHAEAVIGARNWSLVRSYGRLMAGEHCGLYVNALPSHAVSSLIRKLACGEEVDVHLMHRHVSGCYESSKLTLQGGRLWMRFADRSEFALLQSTSNTRPPDDAAEPNLSARED